MSDIERVLVICAHPDDEVLGMGGTIKKFTNAGTEVHVLIFANGNEGYRSLPEKDLIVDIRKAEREKVQKILGIKSYHTYDYGDYAVPADETAYKECIKAIRKYKPDLVFTHYWKEYMAHYHVATIASEAFWQSGWVCSLDLGDPWQAKALYHFEVIELLSDVSHVVDIHDTYDIKLEAMRAYASQNTVVNGALQQITGRALTRGAQAGILYGEGFLRNTQTPKRVESLCEMI